MTREEAIKILTEYFDGGCTDFVWDAYQLAITALEAQDGDMISRQAAVEAICKACSMEEDYHKCDGYPETSTWCDELVALRALPSAQPDKDINVPCTDTISRQAAIDAVYKCANIFINNLPVMVDKADAYKALAELPSAQPEIIRCRDCKHYTFEPSPNSVNCYVRHCTRSVRVSTKPDEFCSRAERRTDEAD